MRFRRFVVVGGLCALLNNAAVIMLVRYGFTSMVASLLAFPAVLLIGYALHSVFTFGAPATTALIFLWSYVAVRWALLPAARSAYRDALRGD